MRLIAPLIALLAVAPAAAHEISSKTSKKIPPAYDITRAAGHTDGHLATFTIEVAGVAGSDIPAPTGKLAGARAGAYVWPTSLDPEVAGFAKGSGILALSVTAHPDFDDTPLFDENRDGDPANDGAGWHSHWVVLVKDESCGGGLKVRDVSPGADALPATAPMLPIALDSPGMSPIIAGNSVRLTVPLANGESASFDAVTSELLVNETGGAPLLCVAKVHDVASKKLTLPGRVTKTAQ